MSGAGLLVSSCSVTTHHAQGEGVMCIWYVADLLPGIHWNHMKEQARRVLCVAGDRSRGIQRKG